MEERNIKKKGITGPLAILMALVIISSGLVPAVTAKEINPNVLEVESDIKAIFDSASTFETMPSSQDPQAELQLLEAYISPAQKAIMAMKLKHYTEDQITSALNEYGYGWDPKTGACWKGQTPTPDEQKAIDKIRGPDYSPFSEVDQRSQESEIDGTTSLRAAGATLNLQNENTYFGINLYMSPGEMVVSPTGTFQHVVTTHVGKRKPSGQEDWTEAGVARAMPDPGTPRRYFTYDNDEGGWMFHGNADAISFKNYKIYVTSTLEPAGYVYHIWIDNTWRRSGHLYYRQTKYNYANEIWAEGSNPFSHDGTSSYFQNGYLYKSTGYQWWGNYPATPTFASPDNPPYETHYMSGSAWKFVTWV